MVPRWAVVFIGNLRLERKHWYFGKNSYESVYSFIKQDSAMQTKSYGFAIKNLKILTSGYFKQPPDIVKHS